MCHPVQVLGSRSTVFLLAKWTMGLYLRLGAMINTLISSRHHKAALSFTQYVYYLLSCKVPFCQYQLTVVVGKPASKLCSQPPHLRLLVLWCEGSSRDNCKMRETMPSYSDNRMSWQTAHFYSLKKNPRTVKWILWQIAYWDSSALYSNSVTVVWLTVLRNMRAVLG